MKTKSILLAALVGAAATAAMSANAGVRFGFAFGLPVPVVTAPVVVTAPAPIVETAPPCPGVDYVWAPGYWSYTSTGYAWVRGGWNYHPRADYGRYDRDHGHDRDNYRGDDHRGDRR